MTLRRSAFSILCSVCLLLAAGAARAQTKAEPSDAARAGARAQANAGLEAFEAGDWQKALDFFQRAESIIHSPLHLSYIGRTQAKLGHLVLAREALMKVMRESADSPITKRAQADAQAALKEIEPRIASLTVQVDGAAGRNFQVTIDGTELPPALVGVPAPADPGTRTVEVVSGSARVTKQVTLADAEGKSLTLVLPPAGPDDAAAAAKPSPMTAQTESDAQADSGGGSAVPVGSIVAFGVGAIGIGLGVGFSLDASSKTDEASQACEDAVGNRSCSGLPINDPVALDVQELDDAASTSRTVATVGFIVGGVGIATGVTLLVLSMQKPSATGPAESAKTARTTPARDFSARPVVGLDYLGVAGTF